MDIVDRIIKIREHSGDSQEKFASRLGLSRNFINQVENRKKNVSDRTISDICRVFNVREEWLRDGTGEMFEDLSNDEKVASILGKIFTDKDSDIYDFKMAVFRELGKLGEKDWAVIQKLVDSFTKE